MDEQVEQQQTVIKDKYKNKHFLDLFVIELHMKRCQNSEQTGDILSGCRKKRRKNLYFDSRLDTCLKDEFSVQH